MRGGDPDGGDAALPASPAVSPKRCGGWILLHAAFVVLIALLVRLPSGPPWPLTAPANLLHVLALPAPALFLACLVRRRPIAAAAQLLALVVAVGSFWPRGTELAQQLHADVDLRVTTFNLGVGLAQAHDVAAFLAAHDPDVVVLLELTRGVAAGLSEEVRASHPHQALYPGGIDGKGVLSKHPILSEERFTLEQGRSYLRCQLVADGREVELVAVHSAPSIGFLGRACAAGRDLETLASSLDPRLARLLVGDFNTTDRSGTCARLRSLGLEDAWRVGASPGFTFPVFGRYFGLPIGRFLRIDQVWHGAGLVPLRAVSGPDLGSDHLPVSVDFSFAAGSTDAR